MADSDADLDHAFHPARPGIRATLRASRSAAETGNVFLGHSQIAITMITYTHVVQYTQRDAVSRMTGGGGGGQLPADLCR
ncbi:hypothetical protein [Streptomyces tubercidicus]